MLNINAGATRNLTLDNDWIHFSARFGGVSHEIAVPIERVAAIFARENNQGLHFEPVPTGSLSASAKPDEPTPPPKSRPSLKVVK